jgi:hypothetical protein
MEVIKNERVIPPGEIERGTKQHQGHKYSIFNTEIHKYSTHIKNEDTLNIAGCELKRAEKQ